MWKFIQAITTDLFTIPRYKGADGKVDPAYDEKSYLWRLKNVTILATLTAAMVLHLGHVYGIGWGEGFASNEDVKDIQITQIEERLDKYYAALCMNPGRQELIDLIRDLQAKYEMLTGRRYEPLSCDLLLQINA